MNASVPPRAPVAVQSVTGPVSSADLGITLTHEHLVNDLRSWHCPADHPGWRQHDVAGQPVGPGLAWDLRQDPFANLDNCALDDIDVAVAEVGRFTELGGRTILETTGLGIGRDLAALREISERSGVTIVAGTGIYLARPGQALGGGPPGSDPRAVDAEELAAGTLADLERGENGVRPGFIGEIGVGVDFTDLERNNLRSAFLAQRQAGVPVQVHLPGWARRGHDVLDLAEEVGVVARAVVLCHMGPSGPDGAYQRSLLRRGAWVQYDMIGMDVYFADQDAQCPSDRDNVRYLSALAEDGFLGQLLISQDVFLKSLLRSNGGPGYAHILQYFVPQLRAAGFTEDDVTRLLVANPRELFEGSA